MIAINFTRAWSRDEDAGGNVSRQYPSSWRGVLPFDVAVEAVADGAAVTVDEMSKKFIAAVEAELSGRSSAAEEAERRRQVAEAIREDAAKVIVASDDELVAMAEQAEQAAQSDSTSETENA